MKKRRVLLITLLVPLCVLGIFMLLAIRIIHQEQQNAALIIAVKADNLSASLAALKAGADPNARDYSDDAPLSFSEHMKQLFDKVLHSNVKTAPDGHKTALFFALQNENFNSVLLKPLLDAGANPNLHGSDNVSPL